MFVELRTYQLLPGRIPEYLEMYEKRGLVPQSRYIPHMLGYYGSEIGGLNEVVHLWGHDSLDAREENRQRMRADPEFKAYWNDVKHIIVQQQCRILRPAPFFVEALKEMTKVNVAALLAAKR